jgi:hypothetical protein
MTTRTTPRIALLGIALGMIFIPALSGKSQAQHIDLNAVAEAKAQAGREALSHPATDPPGPKAAGTFITFDAPGAGTGFGQGTSPASINQAGDITGDYADANGVGHGFVRASNGMFTTFDVPGGTTAGASSINPAGSVTGAYTYLNDTHVVPLSHGYLRAKNGAFTTFDAPGSSLRPRAPTPRRRLQAPMLMVYRSHLTARYCAYSTVFCGQRAVPSPRSMLRAPTPTR